MAQTFTAPESGWLVVAEVRGGNTVGTTGDWELRLSPVELGGAPSQIVLATATIPDGSVPEGSIGAIRGTFSPPVPLAAGTDYALVLTRPGSTFVSWANSSNACAGSFWVSLDQTGPYLPSGPVDYIFTTVVRS